MQTFWVKVFVHSKEQDIQFKFAGCLFYVCAPGDRKWPARQQRHLYNYTTFLYTTLGVWLDKTYVLATCLFNLCCSSWYPYSDRCMDPATKVAGLTWMSTIYYLCYCLWLRVIAWTLKVWKNENILGLILNIMCVYLILQVVCFIALGNHKWPACQQRRLTTFSFTTPTSIMRFSDLNRFVPYVCSSSYPCLVDL